MSADFSRAVEGLSSLGSPDDPGVRPVILRVLVDLFALKPYHAPDEVARFEEIASRLIDRAEPEVCAFVARRIADHACAPPELLGKLARASVEAAVAVMGRAREVSPARLAAAAAWGPDEVAAAIAGRGDLDGSLVAALAMRPERTIALALARNAEAPLSQGDLRALAIRARTDADLARAILGRADPALCGPLFLHADGAQRLSIVAATQRAALADQLAGRRSSVPPRPLAAGAAAALERAAFARDGAAFAGLLAPLLGLDGEDAGLLIADAGGEPLAVALAALAPETDLADRILIFLAPGEGDSLHRFDRLRRLALDLRPQAARRLIGDFAGAAPGGARRHAPLLEGTDAPARTAPRARADVVTPLRRSEPG